MTPIGLRHPAFVAKWGMTVDHISNGRLLLQVGAGHQQVEYESFGFVYPKLRERVERLREGVQLIRELWQNPEPVTFRGNHYQIEEIPFWPKPIQERPEIWLGGSSKWIRALLPQMLTPEPQLAEEDLARAFGVSPKALARSTAAANCGSTGQTAQSSRFGCRPTASSGKRPDTRGRYA